MRGQLLYEIRRVVLASLSKASCQNNDKRVED